jgi:hypothetical protein
MLNIQLRLPLRDISVNQPFGVNFYNFYSQMGLKGHNGVDFRAKDGFNCYASHAGIVTWAGEDNQGGISVNLSSGNDGFGYYTIYYHLKDVVVAVNDKVQAGQLIGHTDNTGKYTTGDHLHFGLKLINNGLTMNKDNGYLGAIDPTPYFNSNYQGYLFNPKDCYKSNAYHRYFRLGRNIKLEWQMVFTLMKILKRLPSNEEVNSAVYGAWDRESLLNPAMHDLCAYITKGDFLNGIIPFQTNGNT